MQHFFFQVCNRSISGLSGVIESPNFPNSYSRNTKCIWNVMVPKGNNINITFSHFEIRQMYTANSTCTSDYLKISLKEENFNDVTYVPFKTLCGAETIEPFRVNSNDILVEFVATSGLVGAGFRMEWLVDGCGGTLQRPSGKISSPNYPNAYPTSLECNWTIPVEYGKSVEITFVDLDLESSEGCEYDQMAVYDGVDSTSPLLGKFCQSASKTILTSTGPMFVHFLTDASFHGRGFMATYKTINASMRIFL